MRKIIMLRHDALSVLQLAGLHARFPDENFQFIRTDPSDHMEHDKLCKEHGDPIVFLPCDEPIPATAMSRGIAHVVVTPDGQMKKLVKLIPVFEDF